MVIGVTDEDVATVDKWIAKKKPGYPIVVVKSDTLAKFVNLQGYPTKAVVDAKGILTYAGFSEQSALKDALKGAKPGPIWPKKLEKTADAIARGELARGWAELQIVKKEGALDEREQKLCERFGAQIQSTSGEQVEKAKKAMAKGHVGEALHAVEGLAKADPPLPASADAQKLVDELKATPRLDDELKGGEAYAAALAFEEAQEFTEATEGYKVLAKKFAGTKIAEAALSRAQDLIAGGMPGFSAKCKRCTALKKACDKHAKLIKL